MTMTTADGHLIRPGATYWFRTGVEFEGLKIGVYRLAEVCCIRILKTNVLLRRRGGGRVCARTPDKLFAEEATPRHPNPESIT